MAIIRELKAKVFNDDFPSQMVVSYLHLRNHFQKILDNGNYKYPTFSKTGFGRNLESVFLSVLSREIYQRLPDFRVLMSVDVIFEDQGVYLPPVYSADEPFSEK